MNAVLLAGIRSIAQAAEARGLMPRWVLCRSDKRPVRKGWQKGTPPTIRQAEAWLKQAEGNLLALVPATVDCIVVDIDEGGEQAENEVTAVLGPPLARVPSRREDGFHLWYRRPSQEVRNWSWKTENGSGEFRGDRGFAILWHPADHETIARSILEVGTPAPDMAHLHTLRTRGANECEESSRMRDVSPGSRNNELNRRAYLAAKNGNHSRLLGLRGEAIEAGLPPDEVDRTLKSATEAGKRNIKGIVTEFELADLLVREMHDTVLYDPSRGWHAWEESGGWQFGGVVHRTQRLIDEYLRRDRKRFLRRASVSRNSTVNGVLALARERLTRPTMIAPDGSPLRAWDTVPNVVCGPSGRQVFMITTGRARSSSVEDLMLRRLGAQPAASCDWWHELVVEWMGGDVAMAEYLQRTLGYALTGNPREQQVFVHHGPLGGEGKSTFMRAVIDAAGTYGSVTSPTTFAGHARDRDHPTDLAKLAGRRIVAALEAPENSSWRAETLKTISGGDRISARFMRRDHFEFDPTCVLFLVANSLPRIGEVDGAIRRRLRIISWDRRPAKKDVRLPEKIVTKRGEVVRWMLDGARDYLEGGLREPAKIDRWTTDYVDGEDTVGRFLREFVIRDPSAVLPKANLREAYNAFCDSDGRRPVSPRAFNAKVRDVAEGEKTQRVGGKPRNSWIGIMLVQTEIREDQPL